MIQGRRKKVRGKILSECIALNTKKIIVRGRFFVTVLEVASSCDIFPSGQIVLFNELAPRLIKSSSHDVNIMSPCKVICFETPPPSL